MTIDPSSGPLSQQSTEVEFTPTEHDHLKWFREHYDDAANQIIEFMANDGFDMAGKIVADIGAGDGIIDLGVFHKASPAKLVGYDMRSTDRQALSRMADAYGLSEQLPDADSFSFVESGVDHIPAESDTFDHIYTWSVFEHVSRPVEMFREIQRILKPDGTLFLQLWPLYYSRHGGHLWMTFKDEDFPHLLHSDEEIKDRTRFEAGTDPSRSGEDEYLSLNRLTVDDLQRAMLAGGMLITKLELMTETVHLPPKTRLRPLSSLGISGVKLLAVPRFK